MSSDSDSKAALFFMAFAFALFFLFPIVLAIAVFVPLRWRLVRRDWVLLTLVGVVGAGIGGGGMITDYFQWLVALFTGDGRWDIPFLALAVYGLVFLGLGGFLASTSVAGRLPGLLGKRARLSEKAQILPTEMEKNRLEVVRPPVAATSTFHQALGKRKNQPPPNSFQIGVDTRGQPMYISENEMGTHALLFGSTGSGKTVTIEVIAGGLADLGQSGLILDLKEDTKAGGLRDWCKDYAQSHQIPYQELCLSDLNPQFWFNPLAGLGQDEARDTILALSKFDDEYYQSVSKLVLGQVLKLMYTAHEIDPVTCPLPSLSTVANVLSSKSIGNALRKEKAIVKKHLGDERFTEEYRVIIAPEQVEQTQANSWGAKLGGLFQTKAAMTMLRDTGGRPAIDVTQPGLTYVGLDSTSKLDLARIVSAAVLQRISVDAAQRTTGAQDSSIKRFVIVDEASIVDRDITQALLSKARAAGVSMVLATQGPRDWRSASGDDYAKLAQNINVAIVMSQGDPEAAQLCADYIGKQEFVDRSYTHEDGQLIARGSVQETRDYLVSPDELRRLHVGEAVVRVGKPEERVSWVKVIPRDATAGASTSSLGPTSGQTPPLAKPPPGDGVGPAPGGGGLGPAAGGGGITPIPD